MLFEEVARLFIFNHPTVSILMLQFYPFDYFGLTQYNSDQGKLSERLGSKPADTLLK